MNERLDKELRKRKQQVETMGSELLSTKIELLRFARTSERIALEPVDLKSIVQEILKEQAITEPNYNKVKVVNDIPESLSRVQGERESLKQAFLNIISNAYQAMPKGGTLKLKAEENDKSIQFTISDTGMGIPPREKELIFEPFFTTKDKKGSGLGMAISYGIIKRIGGDIKVDSEEGKGTTFTVFLKVQESR